MKNVNFDKMKELITKTIDKSSILTLKTSKIKWIHNNFVYTMFSEQNVFDTVMKSFTYIYTHCPQIAPEIVYTNTKLNLIVTKRYVYRPYLIQKLALLYMYLLFIVYDFFVPDISRKNVMFDNWQPKFVDLDEGTSLFARRFFITKKFVTKKYGFTFWKLYVSFLHFRKKHCKRHAISLM